MPSLWEISLCCNKQEAEGRAQKTICLSPIYITTTNFTQTVVMTAKFFLKVINSHTVETTFTAVKGAMST